MVSNRWQLMQKAHNHSAVLPAYSGNTSRYAAAALDLRSLMGTGTTFTGLFGSDILSGSLVSGSVIRSVVCGIVRHLNTLVHNAFGLGLSVLFVSVSRSVLGSDSPRSMSFGMDPRSKRHSGRSGKAAISGYELTGIGRDETAKQPEAYTLANTDGNPEWMPAFTTQDRFHVPEINRERGSKIRS